MRVAGIWIFILFQTLPAFSQVTETFPLRGKTVAVYLSKKQFTYDDNYLVPLSQFVKTDQAVASVSDDLKLNTLISLGRMLSAQLKKATLADSVYFLNENPALAEIFLDKYRPEARYLPALGNSFSGTDFIMVVNPMTLGSFKVTNVFSHSNRIITEQVVKKSGRMKFEVYEPVSGLKVTLAESCWDEQQPLPRDILFDFHNQDSPTGKFLAVLFTLAAQNLNGGVMTNCTGK